MAKLKGSFFIFLLLFCFISTTLFANFLHMEKCVKTSDSCPVCNFQNSTFSTDLTPAFILPQLALLESLKTIETPLYCQPYLVIPSSRSPPLI